MNPQRDRGIRAEREACALLAQALNVDVRRRANEGIRQDIGDLIGVPDTTIQVSAVPDNHTKIAARAATKTRDAEQQRRRAGAAHALVLLRIDGGMWRAVIDSRALTELGANAAQTAVYLNAPSPGLVIRWAPMFSCRDWSLITGTDTFVGTVDSWARTYHQNQTARQGASPPAGP